MICSLICKTLFLSKIFVNESKASRKIIFFIENSNIKFSKFVFGEESLFNTLIAELYFFIKKLDGFFDRMYLV